MGLTDHNKVAENLICGLTRAILGFRGLPNLKRVSITNRPIRSTSSTSIIAGLSSDSRI